MNSNISMRGVADRTFPLLTLTASLGLACAVGVTIGLVDPTFVVGAIILFVVIALRQDEIAAVLVILVSLYYDWYWAYRVIALVLVFLLLVIFYLNRSSQRPWVGPRGLWLWAAFLALAIFPAMRGALTVHDAIIYYPSVISGALTMCWLGTVIGRDAGSMRRFFNFLTIFGVLVAIHIIIQSVTGITLFESPAVRDYLSTVSNYQFTGSADVSRLGSFFIQPNFCGTFLAMMIFLPLALFVDDTAPHAKVLHLAEMLVMIPALLFTYSASAWIAAGVGLCVFTVLVGRTRSRVQISLFAGAAAAILLLVYPTQLNLLLRHATDPSELLLRSAVWQTALRVIQAYPLTGVGLGHLAYLQRAEPYRVPSQFVMLDHPHNSYLEWAAMGGIPVLVIFLAILAWTILGALRNWWRADVRTRALLGAGVAIAVVLSINSWSNQGWTLPPLAAMGWMLLGCVSSPLLKDKGRPQGSPRPHIILPRPYAGTEPEHSVSPIRGEEQIR